MSKSFFTVKRAFLLLGLLALYFVVIRGCSFHALPEKKIPASKVDFDQSYEEGVYQFSIGNMLNCPMRFYVSCQDEEVNKILQANSPILLDANTDTSIIIKDKGDLTGKIKLSVKYGNPELPIKSTTMESLPFPQGKSYKLLQGNRSSPTHNTELSRYAFDFTLESGDTITSSQAGYVVGVVEGYKGWGMSDKWKSYGNQVMIYDSVSHLFTMYGHLKYKGALVEVGEYVKVGQNIALSGRTGQTTEEHLHFNVFQADKGKRGIKSYPLDSIGNYKVKELKRNQWLKH